MTTDFHSKVTLKFLSVHELCRVACSLAVPGRLSVAIACEFCELLFFEPPLLSAAHAEEDHFVARSLRGRNEPGTRWRESARSQGGASEKPHHSCR